MGWSRSYLVFQLAIKMDALEQYLKIEKLDPAEVSDASITHKEEKYNTMNQMYSEVEGHGKSFIKEAKDVSMRPPPGGNVSVPPGGRVMSPLGGSTSSTPGGSTFQYISRVQTTSTLTMHYIFTRLNENDKLPVHSKITFF